MPVSCLPGRYGIGDFGWEARQFVDWLGEAGIRQWSILPLNPTSFGNSPYQSPSAFAGSINYISPDILEQDGLLCQEELEKAAVQETQCQVDYGRLFTEKPKLLRQAYRRFREQERGEEREYQSFCCENREWLEDYALFMAIKEKENHEPWQRWPRFLAQRREPEFSEYRSRQKDETDFWRFVQYIFFRQWNALREYANRQGIDIIGDMPFYVSHDSVDVWCCRELFAVGLQSGEVKIWAGVPDDSREEKYRNWGNPVYVWKNHQADGYDWFRRRIRMAGRMYDGLRIDHAIALSRFYAIEGDAETGREKRRWCAGPDAGDDKLSHVIAEEAGRVGLSVMVEDLGIIPEGFQERMQKIGWPGMRLLQIAFTDKYGLDSNHLPFSHEKNMVVYTGTHDQMPLRQYLEELPEEKLAYMRWWTGKTSRKELSWALIKTAYQSVACQVILPLQDLLELGEEGRLVYQDRCEDSWKWRLSDMSKLDRRLADRLKRLAVLTGRCPEEKQRLWEYLQ
jgi:4-alpha-glucanotransferase